jgi:site-specific DNA-methyltransferase (adenine-specific)
VWVRVTDSDLVQLVSSQIYFGDCREFMATLPDNSVDAIVTDSPYGLEFMGKDWDAPWKQNGDSASVGFQEWCEAWATEALRVLKPGGHLLAFGGTRTWHRLTCAIEDAGFEIRDSIAWLYGSGFPKSHDVSKAIDKAAGAEREVKWVKASNPKAIGNGIDGFDGGTRPYIEKALLETGGMHPVAGDTPATPEVAQWQGWGTALKPALNQSW